MTPKSVLSDLIPLLLQASNKYLQMVIVENPNQGINECMCKESLTFIGDM